MTGTDNIFRTFADKETVDYSEKEKKFFKTELVKKPFEVKKRLFQRMEQHLDEAIDKVNSLAKEPKRVKDVQMVEPSMLGAVAELEFQYGQMPLKLIRKCREISLKTINRIIR